MFERLFDVKYPTKAVDIQINNLEELICGKEKSFELHIKLIGLDNQPWFQLNNQITTNVMRSCSAFGDVTEEPNV